MYDIIGVLYNAENGKYYAAFFKITKSRELSSMFNHKYIDLQNLSQEEQSICYSNDVRFITNFDIKYENLYREAAKIHNIRIYIGINCYDSRGRQYDNGQHSKAFYVGNEVGTLTEFWNTFNTLKKKNTIHFDD